MRAKLFELTAEFRVCVRAAANNDAWICRRLSYADATCFSVARLAPGAGLTTAEIAGVGNRHMDDATAGRMTGMMTFLGDSLKHYCETGEILRFQR